MKKLSRDERWGAALLALFVLLIIGAAFLLRECNKNADKPLPPEIKIIYSEPDSLVNESEVAESPKSGKKKGSKKSSEKSKKEAAGKSKKSKKGNNGEKKDASRPNRDYLSDPIPTK